MRRRPSSSSSSSSGRFKRFRFWVVLSVCVRLRRVVVAVRLRCLFSSHAPDRQGVGILLAKMRRRRLNRRRRVLVLMFVLVDPGHPYTSSESSSGDESDTQSNRLRLFKSGDVFFVFFVFCCVVKVFSFYRRCSSRCTETKKQKSSSKKGKNDVM